MKRNIILFVLILCSFVFSCTGCTEDAQIAHRCVKCGKIATTTLSGAKEIMQGYGISIGDCRQVTSNVYSAYVCDACAGPVVEITPGR